MNNENEESGGREDGNFDLLAPSGQIAKRNDDADRPAAGLTPSGPRPRPKADESLKQMAWKGFEDKEEKIPDGEEPVAFGKRMDNSDDGLDMTPMVDVTFLLLIFFMVTASFSLQRSIQQPPSQINEPSMTTIDEPEMEDDYVEVIIDQNDNYYVTTREDGEVETPSETMMRTKVNNAKKDYGAERLIITAHVDSTHERVIKVWDAGLAAGLTRVQMKTTEQEY